MLAQYDEKDGFSFGGQIKISDDVEKALDQLEPGMLKTTTNVEGLAMALGTSDQKFINFCTNLKNGNITLKEGQTYLQTYQENVTSLSARLKSLATSAKAFFKNLGGNLLAGTINVLGGMLISSVVSLIGIGVSKLYKQISGKAAEEAKQEIQQLGETARSEFKSIQDEMNATASKVNEVKDRYAELAQGVGDLGKATQNQGSLSNDDYEEFLNISNDLADLFPTLTNGYTDNGDAILDLNGDVQTITSSLNGLVEAQKAVAAQDMAKQMPDIFKSYRQDMNDDVKKYNEALEQQKKAQEAIAKLDDSNTGESYITYFDDLSEMMQKHQMDYDSWISQTGHKANKATEDLKVETNEIRELAEKGVDHVTTYFYQSDSATELVGGEWTTNSVTWISGKYVWQKVITYYKDRTDNSQTAKAICISGANGQDGKPGENGVKGKGVKSIAPQYAISDSNVLQPNEGWSDKEPEWSEGKYIWTRTLVIYDDNTQEITTPIVSNGLNSALSISTVARKQANTANTNASNALTTATSANTTAKEAETKAQQSLDQFLWLVKSSSSSTSLTLTDSAVAAITKQFIIKSPDGSATIIEGGKLKTDALKSNNYVAGNDGTYSSLGTFFDLSNGEIHTPGFYLDSVGNTFYQGTVNADAGYFGDANNNWYIGSAEFDNIRNKDDALVNGVEYSALISKGNAALTAGHWYLMSQDGSLGIQSGWTTINGGNYVFDKETQKYYDMGMVEPIFGSKNEWDNKFLYIRRVKDPSSSQATWEYLFKVDKDGTIYENGTKLSDKYALKTAIGSTYLPITGGTVTGNLTVNGTLTGTASKANQLTHTLSINGKSWNGSADLTVGTMGVAYGGTGKSSWTTNGIVYASGSGTLSQLSLGTSGYVLASGGTSAPSWVNPSTLNVATATKATKDGNGNTISDTYLRKDFDSVTQNVTFGGSVDVSDLTAETLLVSGVARFSNGLIGNLKGTVSNAPWSGITGKPDTFTPSAHTHTMANISDWGTYVYSAQGTRTKNTVLAAPNGSDGKATFRTLVEADIPTLSKSKVGLGNVDNTSDSTKNVLSATKLTTARKIGSATFDGSADITLADIGASSSSHTHNYASTVILAGTDYSCVSNAITITKANLQTAIGSTGLGLMTEKERSKLDSIKVSSGGTIDFSGVTASGALAATIGDDKTVAITHNVSGVKAGTYKSVTVDTYGHVTAGTNPTTLSGYGITDALSSSTKYALSDSVGGNALKANLLANLYSNRPTNANIAITGSGGLATFKATKLMTTYKPKSDGHILHFYWDNTGGYDSQLAVTIGENPELQMRGQQAGTWGEWQTVLSSNNYTDYTVKKDGTGASGTWDIDITGNAATATKATSADSATKATQDGNGRVISSTYLPLSGGSMTGTIVSSSAAQVLRWTSSATSVNSTGCSWYGLGTYRADDGYNWLNISNYWGINFTTTSSNRFTHNGNIIITSANIGSQSVASATKATQDGAGNVITSKYVTIDTTQTISGAKTFSKETTISSVTASTNKITGALKVKGGIASEGQISADKAMIGDAVTLEYNAELQCLNFVFA